MVRLPSFGICCLAFVGLFAAIGGCGNEGVAVPKGRINFPQALRVSEDGKSLYVLSSNFDLRYRRGALHVFNLEILNDAVRNGACSGDNKDPQRCVYQPTESPRPSSNIIEAVPLVGLLRGEVLLGSYGSSIASYIDQNGSQRLYVPTRSGSEIVPIDISDNGVPLCPQNNCDLSSTIFPDAPGFDNLSTDPVAIAAAPLSIFGQSENAAALFIAHRGGDVSMLIDQADSAPTFVTNFTGLDGDQDSISVDSRTGKIATSSRARGSISTLNTTLPANSDNILQTDLVFSERRSLRFIGGGNLEVRSVAFDPRPNVERVYALSRSPRGFWSAPKVGELGEAASPVQLGRSPSVLDLVEFNVAGQSKLLAFVSCFDDDEIDIIDVDAGRLIGVSRGLGAPFALAVSATKKLLYVGDFRNSVVRVVDLGGTIDCLEGNTQNCEPKLIATLGAPQKVSEFQ